MKHASSPEEKPEFESVESFVEFLLEDERTTYNGGELNELARHLQKSHRKLQEELADWGATLERRQTVQSVRGFHSNSHDRWSAYPSHGGTGFNALRGGRND